MTYSSDQPRVPAGSSDGGEWTNGGGTFSRDAAQWVHPTSGEKRIYLNNHAAGRGDKVWIHAPNGQSMAGAKWDASMKANSYGETSSASTRAGSHQTKDIALTAAEMKIEEHGGNARTLTFDQLWAKAKPAAGGAKSAASAVSVTPASAPKKLSGKAALTPAERIAAAKAADAAWRNRPR